MVKKAIAIGAAGLMLLSVAVPVLGRRGGGGSTIEIESENEVDVGVGMEVEAETGDNEIETEGMIANGGGTIITGDALATGLVSVESGNRTYVGCCWKPRGGRKGGGIEIEIESENEVDVGVGMEVEAETGDNEVETEGMFACGGGRIVTGWADAMGGVEVVSYNVTRLGGRR